MNSALPALADALEQAEATGGLALWSAAVVDGGGTRFAAGPPSSPITSAAHARWLTRGDPSVIRILIEREGNCYMTDADAVTPLPGPLPPRPRPKPQPAKKPAKRPGRKRSVKSGAVKMKRSRGECEHPKDRRRNLGYAVKCEKCGHVI